MYTINNLHTIGYNTAKYMLILHPHEELQSKILKVRESFNEKYHTTLSFIKPHIMLASFVTVEAMEKKIIQRLQTLSMGTAPFKVDLKDYGSLPTHTIFIQVVTKNAIQRLIKELRTVQKLMKSPDHDPYFIVEPYISITQKLTDTQYQQAWTEYAHRHFTGSFISDSMLLLKKKPGIMKYEIVHRFKFQNMPVCVKQGELFS